ncbi:MAG: SDR family NAD(P)-dependent oxidoreductase [Myxococcales bacterium]|nr:SDR family NAD(P)-dependent oxidoreductase [Myxococcales bacterium]
MSIYGWFQRTGESGFGYNSSAEDVTAGLDLSGKTYLVTGSNSGLGLETMRVLAMRGARVLGCARTQEKADAACASVSGDAVGVACELSEPDSVRASVEAVKALGHPLDGIVANAGIMALPTREKKHGLEMQFLTNHVGHHILITGLLDELTEDGRVVMLSSSAHRGPYRQGIRFDDLSGDEHYSAWGAYGQSKLANVLFATGLAKRLPEGQTANAVHPGVIATNLGRHMPAPMRALLNTVAPVAFLKNVGQGAATQTYVATHPSLSGVTGRYFEDCNEARPSAFGRDEAMVERLWETTESLVADL